MCLCDVDPRICTSRFRKSTRLFALTTPAEAPLPSYEPENVPVGTFPAPAKEAGTSIGVFRADSAD